MVTVAFPQVTVKDNACAVSYPTRHRLCALQLLCHLGLHLAVASVHQTPLDKRKMLLKYNIRLWQHTDALPLCRSLWYSLLMLTSAYPTSKVGLRSGKSSRLGFKPRSHMRTNRSAQQHIKCIIFHSCCGVGCLQQRQRQDKGVHQFPIL